MCSLRGCKKAHFGKMLHFFFYSLQIKHQWIDLECVAVCVLATCSETQVLDGLRVCTWLKYLGTFWYKWVNVRQASTIHFSQTINTSSRKKLQAAYWHFKLKITVKLNIKTKCRLIANLSYGGKTRYKTNWAQTYDKMYANSLDGQSNNAHKHIFFFLCDEQLMLVPYWWAEKNWYVSVYQSVNLILPWGRLLWNFVTFVHMEAILGANTTSHVLFWPQCSDLWWAVAEPRRFSLGLPEPEHRRGLA